jgi:dGTP triphosphohydrolase
VPETSSKIDKQDSLAVAFGKVEAQINTANATRAQEVKALTDNLNKEIKDREDAIAKEIKDREDAIAKEIKDRDAAILVEKNARIESINKEIQDRKDAITKEVQDRDAAILVETNARIKAINDLKATIPTEDSEIITSITQTNGLVSAGKKKIGDIALTGWSLGENVVDSTPISDRDNVFNAFAKV